MIDSLTNWIVTNLAFFASGLGVLTIGAVALLIILLWDWRVTLLGLVIIQIGVIVLATKVYQLPLIWSNVQLMVTTFVAGMFVLSARQVSTSFYLRRPGSWLVRLCAVTLLIVSWQFVDFTLPIPLLTPEIAQLFLWLTVCSLVLMGLSDSPLYTGVALLFWFIPIQVLIELVLPGRGLFVQIGIVELIVGLTCSYLLLTQREPMHIRQTVATDVSFPTANNLQLAQPSSQWAPRLENRQNDIAPNQAPKQPSTPLAPRSLPLTNATNRNDNGFQLPDPEEIFRSARNNGNPTDGGNTGDGSAGDGISGDETAEDGISGEQQQ